MFEFSLCLPRLVACGQYKLPTMKLEQFAMERMQSTYENLVEFNLSESGVRPLTPRELIELAGGEIAEMEKNRDQSFCCSAGGGRILAEEKLGTRINIMRVKMAAATGAGLLLANCPFCLTMFEDGVKGANIEESLKPKDIAEVLAERLQVRMKKLEE